MRYVAAYLLASLGGKTPSAADIEKILSSVGIECESDRAKKVIDELKGKDLADVIEEGSKKLASVPAGGGGGAPAAAGGAAPDAGDKPAEKKEEKKEESEESDDDMGFGLFD